jgi:hypothetical protein
MIGACRGPNETAGKEQDKATAAALGQRYSKRMARPVGKRFN